VKTSVEEGDKDSRILDLNTGLETENSDSCSGYLYFPGNSPRNLYGRIFCGPRGLSGRGGWRNSCCCWRSYPVTCMV